MSELRYGFGKNWNEFVANHLSDEVVEKSVEHMKRFMREDSLAGKTFLDIGCGSGIHSLAAKKLGASKVIAFDYDLDSVNTAKQVRDWSGQKDNWEIMQGSVLDKEFMKSLEKTDVVYSWGVLHHTGSMWEAIENAAIPMKDDSEFYIALYSSDIYLKPTPDFWIKLKRAYNQADSLTKALMELKYVYWIYIRPEIEAGNDPLSQMENYGKRGMTVWTDAKDWMGGFPMEFAGFNETRLFCAEKLGLDLVNVLTGEGCTEYLFTNTSRNKKWAKLDKTRKSISMKAPFGHSGGNAFYFKLPKSMSKCGDDSGDHMASTVMIYENGNPLGIAHCVHDDIREHGGGRFSHWGEHLIFSTSDNSDPNSNEKTYSYCKMY